MLFRSLCASLIALALLCSLYSCAAVVAGSAGAAATYSYIEGKVSSTRNTSIDHAYTAAITACKDLGLTIEKQSKNLSEASISGKDGDRPFWIWISSENSVRSKISVRVGLLGDRQASETIQNRIASHL
jgi:hypothetical protein